MKTTSDGKTVPARCWYYLLDWNKVYPKEFYKITNTDSLLKCDRNQFWNVFTYATQREEQYNLNN